LWAKAGCHLGTLRLADWPSTKLHKPVSTLPPQMSAVLIWSVFPNVARALFSNSLVVGERAEDSLVRPLVHTARPERLGATRSPFKQCAQFLYPTCRAIPTVAHRRLISNPGAMAAGEKPDAVMVILKSSIKSTRRAATFGTQEHRIAPAIMPLSPVAADNLPNRIQPLATGRARRANGHGPTRS
jgi:hypothetical protein